MVSQDFVTLKLSDSDLWQMPQGIGQMDHFRQMTIYPHMYKTTHVCLQQAQGLPRQPVDKLFREWLFKQNVGNSRFLNLSQ